MGCWHTKHSLHDRHIFKVMNVDEQGHLVCPGQLELTDTEMVLYQKGKSTKWPLAYIRRYGFESELFSFECGRRCPGGHGIYAFRCRRAELLFNLLQERITIQRTTSQEEPILNNHDLQFPIPLVTTGPAVPVRPGLLQSPDTSGYLEPVIRPAITRTQSMGTSRLNSLSSNGPISPEPMEHNNNKRASLDHSYSNTILPEEELPPCSPSPSTCSDAFNDARLYMNINPGDISPGIPQLLPKMELISNDITEEEDRHCYANLETEEIENLRRNCVDGRDLVYAVLDLDKTKEDVCQNLSPTVVNNLVPESPKKLIKGYTVIDFNKTEAVSQIAKPKQDCDGSRKTRHNSTISELSGGGQNSSAVAARHSSSLSD